MRIDNIEFDRTPQVGGWRCVVYFALTTSRQFTDERHQAAAHGRWRWLAFWRAKRVAGAIAAQFGAKAGERAAKGWAD